MNVLRLVGMLLMFSAGVCVGGTLSSERLLLTRVVSGPQDLLGVTTSGGVLRLRPAHDLVSTVDLAEPVLDACRARGGGYWLLLMSGEKRLVHTDARLQRIEAFLIPPDIWRIAAAGDDLWLVPLPRPGDGNVPLYRMSRSGTLSAVALLDPENPGCRFDGSDEVRTALTFIDLGAADRRVVLAFRFFPVVVEWKEGHQMVIPLVKMARRLGHSSTPSPLVRCVVPAGGDGLWVLPWVTSRRPGEGVTLSDRVFVIGGTGGVRKEIRLPGEALGMARRGDGVVLWMQGGSVLFVSGDGALVR